MLEAGAAIPSAAGRPPPAPETGWAASPHAYQAAQPAALALLLRRVEFLEQEAERSTEAHEAQKALLERQAEMQRQSYESQLKRVGRAGGVCWAWEALVCGTRGAGKCVVAYRGTSSIS